MPRGFATRLPCVCSSHWNPSTTKSPSTLVESVHFKEFIRLSALLSEIQFPLPVLWLLSHLDRLFWRHRCLWLTLLIRSVYLRIYPYQLPPHSTGPSPGIPDRHVEWRSHLVLGSRVSIDRVIKSHKCWGDMWPNFSSWLLGSNRLFIFHAISSLYMLLLPFISTFRNHFPMLKRYRHQQESVIPSSQHIHLPHRLCPFSAFYTCKCSPSCTHFLFSYFL